MSMNRTALIPTEPASFAHRNGTTAEEGAKRRPETATGGRQEMSGEPTHTFEGPGLTTRWMVRQR
jgi:hypothetical protein